jgi:hypothetical protein
MLLYSPVKFEFLPQKSKRDGKTIMQLTQDMIFACDTGGIFSGRVPAGFCTDGASIPPSAKSIIGDSFGREYLTAAIVHDALYEIQWDRTKSDKHFYNMMIASGVGDKKSWMMWKAVSWFGKGAFNSPLDEYNKDLLNRLRFNEGDWEKYEQDRALIAQWSSK